MRETLFKTQYTIVEANIVYRLKTKSNITSVINVILTAAAYVVNNNGLIGHTLFHTIKC